MKEVKFLDLKKQYLSIKNDIDESIETIINESAFIGGKYKDKFEKEFADFCGAGFCVGVANGTDALEIGIEALDLRKQSEIIVPANSFISSAEAVTRAGHKVCFADIDPNTYLLNHNTIENQINEKTAAIMAVHLYGCPCNMDEILQVAQKYDLKIIEDCAQAHGAEFKGKKVGTFGDISTFSFYPGKNLGAYGDAGAILTNDANLATKARMIANHGRIEKYNHQFEGRNSRLDGLQAAILSVKLKKLDEWLQRRIDIAKIYNSELAKIKEINLQLIEKDTKSVYHLYVIRVNERDKLKIYLENNGVQTGIHYPISLPKLKAYDYIGTPKKSFNANKFDDKILSLPIGEHLENDEIYYVINKIKDFFQNGEL